MRTHVVEDLFKFTRAKAKGKVICLTQAFTTY